MNEIGLALAFAAPPFLPLVLVALLGLYPRPALLAWVPWMAVPALAVLALPVGSMADYPWLLLGLQLGLDATNRVFLALTAVLWLAAGVYARSYLRDDPRYNRYCEFHLLAMAGNFGLVLAQDAISFYAGFTLMSLASYGLVVHVGSRLAHRAALVYLVMAVLGELMLFGGIVLSAVAADSVLLADLQAATPGPLTMLLLVAGFGIKAGLLGLHLWLPLAHPVAPTPASAVLSGVMIKAGLLGWLRFLPFGGVALAEWGGLLLALGLAGAFFGVLRGLPETDPKKILAYSSISQIGLITSGVGLGLLEPMLWPALSAAVVLYALHHALAKGALFLGVGVVAATAVDSRGAALLRAGMAVLAGALAGLPLTSGATAKYALKQAIEGLGSTRATVLIGLLSLAAVGTTVLMIRLLQQLRFATDTASRPPPGLWLPWGLVALLVIVLAAWHPLSVSTLTPAALWAGLWPIMLGLIVWWLARWPAVRRILRRIRVSIRWSVRGLRHRGLLILRRGQRVARGITLPAWSWRTRMIDLRRRLYRWAARSERQATRWPVFGMAFMALVLLVYLVALI